MATRTISTRLAIDGEAEYRKAISSCASSLSTLKSNLTLTESQFRGNANSMDALSAKGTALAAIYDKQKDKVATLENALKNAQRAQSEYASRVATAKENVERCEKALEDLKNSTGDTSEEQKALTEELEKWNTELAEAEGYEAAAEQGVQNWQKQLNFASIDLNKLSDEIERNNQYLDEASSSADGCATSIDRYGNEAKDAGDQSKKFGDESKSAVENLAAALAAAGITATVKEIADALLACASAAASFENAMAKVATLADTSAISLEEIQSQIITLSGQTGRSAEAIAEATYSAISAGVDTASAVEFVSKATRLASGGFTEAETAVDVLTTALNAYGLSVAEAERVSDILITTQNLGKTTVDELANSVGKVIPLAAAYGVEMDNLCAAYAVLTANGVATAEAGTYLKAMLNELGNSGSTVAGVLQDQTGKSFASLMAGGASLGDVLAILGKSVDGNATAFNELWSSTEAGVGALSIFGSGADNFNGVLGAMRSSAGATATAYTTMAETTEFAQQRMSTALDNLKIAIGTQLNPALEKLYDAGEHAFAWAANFVEEHPWIVSAIAALVTGLGTLATGVAIVTAATAAWNAVLMANPVALVAAGVVALTSAIGAFCLSIGSADDETREFTAALVETKEAYDDLRESMAAEQKSTQSMVDALESALKVEGKSEAQKAAILELVEQLNEAIPGLGLSYDSMSDSINMTADSLDALVDAANAQNEYEAQVSRLSELYAEQADIQARLAEAQAAYDEAMETGASGTIILRGNVDELTAALESNQVQIQTLEEESAAYGEWQAASSAATADMTSKVDTLVAEMTSLEQAYMNAHAKALESIDGQLGLFQELDGTAQTSIGDLIETLSGQCSYMDTYAANIQKAMELGVDKGLVEKLSDGSEESAQILAAIVQGGENEIKALNEKFAKVEEGKENFASTVAEMETDFSKKMSSLETRIEQTVQELNVSAEAAAAGADTIQGYINGAEGMRSQLISTYRSLAESANWAFRSTLDMHSPSRVFHKSGKDTVAGVVLGVEEDEHKFIEAIEGMGDKAIRAMNRSLPTSIEEPRAAASQAAQVSAIIRAISCESRQDTIGRLSVQVYAGNVSDPNQLADIIADRVQRKIERRRSPFAQS